MSELDVMFQSAVPISGQNLRGAYGRPLGEGVDGYGDMLVSAGAAADTVDVAAGIGFVRGDGLEDLGLYRVRNDATKNSAAFEAGGIAAPDSTNPRLDQIIARVYDNDVDAEGSHKWRLAVLKGTATSGASLDNRTGAAALPSSAMLLADVLVPAGAPGVLKAENIRDRRTFCSLIVPPLLTDVDMVPLIPLNASPLGRVTLAHANHDTMQAAIACLLPRRIVAATKIRWKYVHEGTALAGNYVLALFDASGRKIVDTGSVALTGAASSVQVRAETIAATTLEAGVYYLFLGLDSTTGEAAVEGISSVVATAGLSSRKGGANAPNLALRASSGGLTVPTTLLSMTDVAGLTAAAEVPPVPMVTLSVG